MLEVELPKDVLARGPTALSPELIALLDEQLRIEQTKQRTLYEAEVAAKGAKAAAAAGVAADWAPPEQPEEAGYLADGDLALYSEEMLARRQRLRAHPGVVEAIRAWWAWLPKDQVQVFEPDESAEAAASDATTATTTPASDATTAATTTTGDASTSATPDKPAAGGGKRVVPLLGRESPQHAGRGSPLPSAPGGASSSRSASPTPAPTKLGSVSASADAVPPQPPSRTVLGVVKPVYCAFVVVIQLLLLPRYGLEPDPAYDPEEDWQEDNKGEEGPLEYDRFFDALFQLADLWVDGVVAWDYARLLADLLQDLQLHERESLLFSRVMQRFGYVPYYPEWLANGPQFVAPRAIGEMDVDAEAAWQAEDEAVEQRAHEERLAREEAEEEEEEEEGSSDEGSEEEEGDGGQEEGEGRGAREKEETERKVELVRKIMRPAVESSKAATKAGALKAAAGAKRPAPHPHAEGHASLWTAARKAKILGLTRNFALVSRLLLELQAPRRLSAALLEAAAAPQPHHPHPDPDGGPLQKASGLRAMRSRLGAAPAGPTPAADAPYKRPPRVLHMATAPVDKRSRGGRLWKAPPASLPVRHRSPPGTRKARTMPQLPLVQEHLYYILPRYVTYSDQLPDRVAHRPHTAPPDLEQQQESEAEAAAATVGTSGRSQGHGQGDRQSSPLLGALPSPRLACTPLQLTLPPSRRGGGVGPTPLGLAGLGLGPSSGGGYGFGGSPLPSPSHAGSSLRGHLMSRSLNQSPLPSPSGFPSPTPGSGPAFGDRQHTGAEGGDAEAGGWAAAAAEQLLDTFQAAPAAREQLWARVGRGGASPSPRRPSSHPSYRSPSLSKSWDSSGGEALLQHHLNKVQSPPPSAGAASASSLSPSPLPPLRTSALANGGLPHAPSGDLDHPWTPPTPLPASRLSRRSGASVSLSSTQPRSRNTRSTSGVAQSLAGYLGFVERIAPGCPKFYHHRHHRAGPGALSRDGTPQTELTGLSMT